MSEDDFDKVIAVNMKSVFNMTKSVQRTMLKQRSGSIINLSSIVGIRGNAGQSNYSASKAGIIGFTKSIALELGSRNIRCNAIAPGFIKTEMTDSLDDKIIENWTKLCSIKKSRKWLGCFKYLFIFSLRFIFLYFRSSYKCMWRFININI